MRAPRLLSVALSLLLQAGCSSCRRTSGPTLSPRSLAPADAVAYVEAPSLGRLAGHLAELSQPLALLPGGEALGMGLDQLSATLGFDPRQPAALASAGLDGTRPAALVVEGAAAWAALPVRDEGRFRAAIERLAASRLGAPAPREQGGVLRFQGPSGEAALAFRGGYALVGSSDASAPLLARGLSRPLEASLERSPVAPLVFRRLLPGEDLLAYVSKGALPPSLSRLPGLGFGASLSLANRRVTLRALDVFSVGEGAGLSPLALPAGGDLVPLLPPGAPIVGRLGGEPAALAQAWTWLLPAALVDAAREAKLDLGQELFANLRPGIAFALGLAPKPDFSSASWDPRRGNPFRVATLEAVGRVRDPAKALAALPKLLALAPRFGASAERRDAGATAAWTFRYSLGESVTVALAGDVVVVTGGDGQLGPAVDRALAKGARYDPPRELLRALTGHVSDGIAFDSAAAREALSAIPDSAFGGLTGITLRALFDRAEAALGQLGPVVATLQLDADAATIDAEVRLR